FDAVYREWAGRPPSEIREQARRAGIRPPEPPDDELSWGFWIRATVGDLTPEEAQWFLEWLHEQWQRSLERSPRAVPVPAAEAFIAEVLDEKFHALLAEVVWETLPELPPDKQRELVRGLRFGSAVLFDFLSGKIIPESRKDRQRGVEVAGLALESLEASSEAIGEDVLPNLRALGQARLGNALGLALRWDEAERAFVRAEEEWQTQRDSPAPRAEAEICGLKACLRRHQRNFAEALELANRAIALSRLAGDRELVVRALVERALVLSYAGDPKASLPPLYEAEQLVQHLDSRDLHLIVYQCLATSAVLTGQEQEASRALAQAKELCEALANEMVWNQITWVEGFHYHRQGRVEESESLFKKALTQFVTWGEQDLAAMLSLDLASLHFQQGRTAEAIRLVSTTIPVFKALRIHREALAALDLLREVITTNEITLEVLEIIQTYGAALFPESFTALRVAARNLEGRPEASLPGSTEPSEC
ncbi:MAG: tetratricopeptide repeat protein, partial [bacterium]|nr:tetratricopeptide repeat protein [bacterium]